MLDTGRPTRILYTIISFVVAAFCILSLTDEYFKLEQTIIDELYNN